jgi:ATP-dependent Clp protease ATP-binding subunit ClpA
MVEFARNKGHEILGRRHLVYALLMAENGELPRRLQAQGKDAEQLADQIYVAMAPGDGVAGSVEAKAAQMTHGLIRVLCAAEFSMKSAQEKRISQPQLLRAVLRNGGGEAGEFLVAQGVRLSRLI